MQERHANPLSKGRSLRITGVGIDIVDMDIFRRRLHEQEGLAGDIFLQAEMEYCDSRARPWESYAARFAAKEAVFKALGRGLSQGLTFRQVEVTRDSSGAVGVRLTGRALERACEIGITDIRLSMSHTANNAIAAAVAEGRDSEELPVPSGPPGSRETRKEPI